MASTYVYVIGPENGHLKIGIAKNANMRLADLQCGSPLPLILHASLSVPLHLARQIEDHAHWLLYNCRASGEWFSIDVLTATDAVKNAYEAVKKYKSKSRDSASTMLSTRVPAYLATEIDEILRGGEGRSDFVRAAIFQELSRREKIKNKS